mgnify:CR=1 FL=1
MAVLMQRNACPQCYRVIEEEVATVLSDPPSPGEEWTDHYFTCYEWDRSKCNVPEGDNTPG